MSEERKIYSILFMGPSGSGKDTQATLIKNFLTRRDGADSVLYVYTGEILRELAKKETYIAKVVHRIVIDRGDKIPDMLAAWAISDVLIKEMKENQHLLFSSSPRSTLEAELFDNFFEALGRKDVYYIHLKVSRDEATRRLLARGRPDDNINAINNRLDFYEKWVNPALDYCRSKSPHGLIEIDGNSHDEQAIHREVLTALGLSKG